jgi:hypothetical protein
MPTGAHPRAEAAFGPAAESYEIGRPGWPAAALDVVDRRLGLTRASRVPATAWMRSSWTP